MAYRDFKTLESLTSLGVSVVETTQNVITTTPMQASAFLQEALRRFVPLATAINTEKARSEYIIAPILSELAAQNPDLSLFSGRNFNVDPDKGLVGFCDFLITRSSDKISIKSPVAVIVEAKNEDINSG
ncbi:MAG: hypothetical protein F6K65_40720, partial [Moorea sp. SIO3C2]|nr:hypothetical protein [Moorena sp. SIO3C2]